MSNNNTKERKQLLKKDQKNQGCSLEQKTCGRRPHFFPGRERMRTAVILLKFVKETYNNFQCIASSVTVWHYKAWETGRKIRC